MTTLDSDHFCGMELFIVEQQSGRRRGQSKGRELKNLTYLWTISRVLENMSTDHQNMELQHNNMLMYGNEARIIPAYCTEKKKTTHESAISYVNS
jgi:tRNA(Leu) C34 or U34 (ribose-2'-O)-methylase TrmL